jgi:activator of HSP90 ATPase
VLAGLAGGVSVSALRVAAPMDGVAADASSQIDRTCEAIHQEVTLAAPRERVYAVLTDSVMFHQVTLLGAAVRSGMVKATKPTRISRETGGPFALFGGHIVGRHIEIIPAQRIVQAWRVVDWMPGLYSIARFELVELGAGTRLRFDHSGFPKGEAEHLAQGWTGNYWEPIHKFLS